MSEKPTIWKPLILWILAILITLASAVYQRVTGPTYPVEGHTSVLGSKVEYRLLRSHGGPGDQPVVIAAPDTAVHAILHYRRYPTSEPWKSTRMIRRGDSLFASIPHQPPAGKVEYFITLQKDSVTVSVPADRSVVTRFKGAVPAAVLAVHILLMFLAMLFSTRTGLGALFERKSPVRLALWTFILLTLGGMIMGPIVQKYAFGAYWTGVPYGWDLTDNKTLIAWIMWLIALVRGRRSKEGRAWMIAASVVTLVVYLIPHSLLGSELKYTDVNGQAA